MSNNRMTTAPAMVQVVHTRAHSPLVAIYALSGRLANMNERIRDYPVYPSKQTLLSEAIDVSADSVVGASFPDCPRRPFPAGNSS